MSKIERLIDKENLHRTEGNKGVRNLCRLANLLGYQDRTYFGQVAGACYGDLILLLEDNPGLVEAMHEWLQDNLDEEEDPEDEEEPKDECYQFDDDPAGCQDAGLHLKSVDGDGYCNSCGHPCETMKCPNCSGCGSVEPNLDQCAVCHGSGEKPVLGATPKYGQFGCLCAGNCSC